MRESLQWLVGASRDVACPRGTVLRVNTRPDEKTLSTFPSLLFSPVRRVLEDYRTGGFWKCIFLSSLSGFPFHRSPFAAVITGERKGKVPRVSCLSMVLPFPGLYGCWFGDEVSPGGKTSQDCRNLPKTLSYPLSLIHI